MQPRFRGSPRHLGPHYSARWPRHTIDRFGNPVRGLIAAKKAVDDGNIMLVHPEGTRSVDGHLGEMQDGASFISMKSHVPMLPVFLDGAYEVFNRYMKAPEGRNPITRLRREVILTFGKPFNPADFSNAREMTAALTAWMQARFSEKKFPEYSEQKISKKQTAVQRV